MNESLPPAAPARRRPTRWMAVGLILIAALAVAGWAKLGQGFGDTPNTTIRTFVEDYLASDVDGMRAKLTPALRGELGSQVRETLPRGMAADFVVVTDGTKATAKQSTLDWDLSLHLVKRDAWLVDRITVVRKTVGTAPYTSEKAVRVAQLPQGERVALSNGTPGARTLVTATTFVNGKKRALRTLKGDITEQGAASLVVVGTGKAGLDDNVRVLFDGDRFSVSHTVSAAKGAQPSDRAVTPGDRLTYFVILPSGEIAQSAASTWSGDWDDASAGSSLRTRTFKRTWTAADAVAAGAEIAPGEGWPAGRYILGVTKGDGIPVGWSSYLVQ